MIDAARLLLCISIIFAAAFVVAIAGLLLVAAFDAVTATRAWRALARRRHGRPI